jgi:hypothetical protein
MEPSATQAGTVDRRAGDAQAGVCKQGEAMAAML